MGFIEFCAYCFVLAGLEAVFVYTKFLPNDYDGSRFKGTQQGRSNFPAKLRKNVSYLRSNCK